MKNLKRLSAAVALTFVLGAAAFAGEIPSGPCAPPAPGEMNAPPCAAAQVAPADPATPGQLETPPASAMADASMFAISLFESLVLF